jgi:glycosyltransferase involved in cell wall biosynthesis
MIQSSRLTFVIPAYGESQYLEECISSLKNQKVRASICISTSTPSKFIEEIATYHKLPLRINSFSGGIAADWNFALKQGGDDLIVLAHQDDLYHEDFSWRVLEFFKEHPNLSMAFSDSSESINGIVYTYPKREIIKRVLREFAFFGATNISASAAKFRLLSLGCPIPCPSVVFNRAALPNFAFSSEFAINLDWDAWVRMSNEKTRFGYMRGNLVTHRVHIDSETQGALRDNRRSEEDYRMFLRFWPQSISKILHILYRMGYN